MRKNKILSGVLAAVMAAALIPALPADEISAEESLSGGTDFYTVPEDKSEPVKTGNGKDWELSVIVEETKKIVNEEEITEEIKYIDITLWESGDDWKNFKDLGNYALEVNIATEDNLQFEKAMVGSEIFQFTNNELIHSWQTSECEVNDNTIQFIGLGSNLVQSNYSSGQLGIRLVIPSDKAADYVQGDKVKTTIDFAVYKAEKAKSKWNYDSTMSSQNIKPADLASEAGIAADTVEKIDFYSNVPISVTYPSTEGTKPKEVKGCRVSLSDIDFSSTDDLTISTNPSDGGYVPVNWKVYQKVVLSVNKQFTPLENGKYNERAVLEVACPVVLNELDYINITFSYGKHKQTIKANKYYVVILGDDEPITPKYPGKYFFVIVSLINIPDSIVPYEVDGKPAGLDISYELVYKSKT